MMDEGLTKLCEMEKFEEKKNDKIIVVDDDHETFLTTKILLCTTF